MVFTSVAGHLMELAFPTQYKKWRGCSPLDLYTAPVIKDVPNVSNVLLMASMHDVLFAKGVHGPNQSWVLQYWLPLAGQAALEGALATARQAMSMAGALAGL
jgi:hypothetical protein